jgi:predicted aspartyl protease
VRRIAAFFLAAGAMLAAAPAAAAECGPLKLVAAMRAIPIQDASNVLAVPATLDDRRQVKMLLDTGSSFSTVNRAIVDELGLKSEPTKVHLIDLAGQRTSREVRIPSVTVGGARQNGVYLIVNPNDNPVGGTSLPFDGILGADMFRRFDLDMDFGARKINLISPDHCSGRVEYWSAPRVAIVPIRLNALGQVMLPVTLDGHRLTAMLDTGATTTALKLDVARTVFGIDTGGPEAKKIGELKGRYTAPIYRHRFKTLAIEGVVISDPAIDLLPDMVERGSRYRPMNVLIRRTDTVFPDMLLGMSALKRLHVYIAYKEAKLYITESTPQSGAGTDIPPASKK